MLLLIACLSLATTAMAFVPRVKFYDAEEYQVSSRENAISLCLSMNMHIAHESQLVMDIEDGYTGHAQCGWTWTRGRTVHVHCLEKTEDGERCKPGRAEVWNCQMDEILDRPLPAGIFCRTNDDDHTFVEVEDGEFMDIYRAQGPKGRNTLMDVNEAKIVCEAEGSKLAYWSHLAAYVDRYGIQICLYGWLRERNAVFNANCQNNGIIGWKVRDRDCGYDAICIGRRPRKFIDPCATDFKYKILEGRPVNCTDDGAIIIQDRPSCELEEYCFDKGWDDYKDGFGEVGKGFWIGLDLLYKVTKAYRFKLIIFVTSESGQVYNATYYDFAVGSEADNYRLRATGYSGDAGDMFNELQSNMRVTNGQAFSTQETSHDNDGSPDYNCALEYASGWWFQSCQLDNLNGPCTQDLGYRPNIAAFRSWRRVSTNSQGLKATRMVIKYIKDDDATTI